jgi:ArsR family metal-binding transcriptional regulator
LSKTVDSLIEGYEIKLVEPGCAPGTGRWGVQVGLPRDISAVFPYLNAVFNNTLYDHKNQILIIREQNQAYAFRPDEIRIARTDDPSHARQITAELVEKVNRIWQERDSITPRFIDKRPVAVIDIFKLLPKTNCRKCGYLTCLAYAADLRQGVAQLEGCPYLALPEYTENRQKIAGLFISE